MCTWACRPSAAASRRRRASAGHEPDDRLLDQPVHPAGPDPVRERRDLVVHEPRRRRAQARSSRGRSGGPATPAGHRPDPGPGPGEPVPQLEGLTEVGLAGLGGQPDRGRELGHTELRDQRGAGSGDRDRGVAEPDRVADRLRRVQVRPAQAARSRPASAASAAARSVPGLREHPGSGVRCGVEVWVAVAGHGSILVEQVFESRVESVDIRPREHRRSEGAVWPSDGAVLDDRSPARRLLDHRRPPPARADRDHLGGASPSLRLSTH